MTIEILESMKRGVYIMPCIAESRSETYGPMSISGRLTCHDNGDDIMKFRYTYTKGARGTMEYTELPAWQKYCRGCYSLSGTEECAATSLFDVYYCIISHLTSIARHEAPTPVYTHIYNDQYGDINFRGNEVMEIIIDEVWCDDDGSRDMLLSLIRKDVIERLRCIRSIRRLSSRPMFNDDGQHTVYIMFEHDAQHRTEIEIGMTPINNKFYNCYECRVRDSQHTGECYTTTLDFGFSVMDLIREFHPRDRITRVRVTTH